MPLKPFALNRGAEKRIYLLKPRGFCAGVVRAIDVVKIALDLYGPPVYVRKEIVHNKHVVDELRDAGAIFIEELEEVPEGAGGTAGSSAGQRAGIARNRCDLPVGNESASGSGSIRP